MTTILQHGRFYFALPQITFTEFSKPATSNFVDL